jgi:hypothetical protein
MQQIVLSGLQASPIPGLLEITPPPGPQSVKQFTTGTLPPPEICFSADLVRFFVFKKSFVMILFFNDYKYKYLIMNSLKINHKILIRVLKTII